MRQRSITVLALAFLLFANFALAADADPAVTLKMGDRAPALQVDKWVKGGPIPKLEEGKVYILEFWATWCGPCKAAIPHVTELQKKYKEKGLTVIGMNVWEHDLSEVEPFVQEMGDTMDYAVATDVLSGDGSESKGAMAETWMKAAGRNGIPSSFIVNREGVIAWIGHPMQMERPLGQVIDGTYDVAKELENMQKIEKLQDDYADQVKAKDYEKAIATLREIAEISGEPDSMNGQILRLLLQAKDYDKVNELLAKMESAAGNDGKKLTDLGMILVLSGTDSPVAGRGADLLKKAAEKSTDAATLRQIARIYVHTKNYDQAMAVLDQVAAASKDPGSIKAQQLTILLQKKDVAAANKLIAEAEKLFAGDQARLVEISQVLLTNAGVDDVDLEVAARIGEKAVEHGGKRKLLAQRMLAGIYAAKKDYAKAIDVQKQVIEADTKPLVKKMDERALERYEAAAKKAAATEDKPADAKPADDDAAAK